MPTLPITLWTTLSAWLLAMKMLPVKFWCSNEVAVMLFQTSLGDDVFSIFAEDSQLSAAATRLLLYKMDSCSDGDNDYVTRLWCSPRIRSVVSGIT